jgi:radical SAM protein with 4Fe4S-binding SPASM domain
MGKVLDDGQIEQDEEKVAPWTDKDPLRFAECRECAFLPLCMGGCNLRRIQNSDGQYCLDWKYDIPTFLEVLVLNEENLCSSTR